MNHLIKFFFTAQTQRRREIKKYLSKENEDSTFFAESYKNLCVTSVSAVKIS